MKWFEGSIKDAIQFAKQNAYVFVVYIEGFNELTQTMTSVIESPEISSLFEKGKFVNVKIQTNTREYDYFVEIYEHVPVPSLFFIGLNGVPVAVIDNSLQEDAQIIGKKILKLLSEDNSLTRESFHRSEDNSCNLNNLGSSVKEKQGVSHQLDIDCEYLPQESHKECLTENVQISKTAGSQCLSGDSGEADNNQLGVANQLTTEQSQPKISKDDTEKLENEVVRELSENKYCEGNRKQIPQKDEQSKADTQRNQNLADPDSDSQSLLDVPEFANHDNTESGALQPIIENHAQEMHRDDLANEENFLKKEEIENNDTDVKQNQRYDKDKIFIKEKQKEKVQNEIDRQRILKEIAQDREERLAHQRYIENINQNNSIPQVSGLPPNYNSGEPSIPFREETCIQFRRPDGFRVTENFHYSCVINDLRNYVVNNVSQSPRQFDLATAFPRHVFTVEENNKTLQELGLVPNAVILILPASNNTSVINFIYIKTSNIFWYFALPVISLLRRVRENVFRTTTNRMSISTPTAPYSNIRSSENPGLRRRAQPLNNFQNVQTLSDIRNRSDNDDDDDNNVWNGNSTKYSR